MHFSSSRVLYFMVKALTAKSEERQLEQELSERDEEGQQ